MSPHALTTTSRLHNDEHFVFVQSCITTLFKISGGVILCSFRVMNENLLLYSVERDAYKIQPQAPVSRSSKEILKYLSENINCSLSRLK